MDEELGKVTGASPANFECFASARQTFLSASGAHSRVQVALPRDPPGMPTTLGFPQARARPAQGGPGANLG